MSPFANPMSSLPEASISAPYPVLLLAEDLVLDCPGSGPRRLSGLQLRPGLTLVRSDDDSDMSHLLRLLSGTVKPRSGEVQWLLHSSLVSTTELEQLVFWVDPADRSQDQVSVSAYWQQLRGRYPRWNNAMLDELQVELGLTPHLDKALFMLSTGSRRKVALAAALAAGAALTLLNQPYAALDLPSRRCITRCLLDCASQAERIYVMADYEAPEGVPLSQLIDLNRLLPG
ncbi:ATP-binding cassette domain-containing protein [Malikia spinosa]|uniref:ATP-binding cassette domain-containing protein n=2 Tax=Malikia spinosa TaxID=86180 RepID=A0A7C9MWJ2_9BURK|nr:ATP-binding cassette domain-containing protein [Malikia spinosa]